MSLLLARGRDQLETVARELMRRYQFVQMFLADAN